MSRKMKDSGIEWIGEIPEEAQLVQLRYVVDICTGDSDTQDNEVDGQYPFYVRSPIVERSNRYSFDDKEAILMAGDGVGAGRVFHYVKGKYACHQRVYRMSQFKYASSKFLRYYIPCMFPIVMDQGSAKSTVDSVRLPMLKGLWIVIQDKEEQTLISNYLDIHCTLINQTIEKQKQVIEKLKEYKRSVITEAVTKGLNQNVPMKDSGIEWVGEIPEHWDVIKIKNLFSYIDNRNEQDENAILLSLFTAIGVKPRSEMEDRGNKAATVIGYKYVEKDDLIVNKLLAWMGAVAFSDYEGVTSPDYDIYRIKQKANVIKDYYNCYFRFTKFKDDCFKYGHGIMMMRWRTYPSEFLNIFVVNPPKEEQEIISNYVVKRNLEIDNAIESKEKVIEKLESYKKSLIYECVTGKREVK